MNLLPVGKPIRNRFAIFVSRQLTLLKKGNVVVVFFVGNEESEINVGHGFVIPVHESNYLASAVVKLYLVLIGKRITNRFPVEHISANSTITSSCTQTVEFRSHWKLQLGDTSFIRRRKQLESCNPISADFCICNWLLVVSHFHRDCPRRG